MADSKNNAPSGQTRRIRLTLTEECLGSQPGSKTEFDGFFTERAKANILKDATKADGGSYTEDEAAALVSEERGNIEADDVLARGKTVFPRDRKGRPFMYAYQIKGAMKDACSMMRAIPGSRSSKLRAYKKEIDGRIFVLQRTVPFEVFGEIGECARPLRASTPQGDRVAIARSETVPAGSTLTFDVTCFNPATWPLVEEWMTYWGARGLGQWRNSGKGTCTWEYVVD